MTKAMAVAAGGYLTVALTPEGRVAARGWWGAWGEDRPPAGLSNVVAIAAGLIHGLALTVQGEVVGWGDNTYGQSTTPPYVTNIVAIGASAFTSLAVTADGKVLAWGMGYWGETNVPPYLSNVVAVAAGIEYCLALTGEGRVVAWGRTNNGVVNVPQDLTNAVAITAGSEFAFALTEDKRVVGWGGFEGSPHSPTIPPGASNIVRISAAPSIDGHKIALIDNEGVIPFPTRPQRWKPATVSTTRLSRGRIVVCWPTNYSDFTLLGTRHINRRRPERTKWKEVRTIPVLVGDSFCVTNRILREGRFYRIAKP